MLAPQQLPGLGDLDLARQFVQRGSQLAGDVLALPGPLDEHRQVGLALLQLADELHLLLEAVSALQDALRLGLVLPEVGLREQRLQPRQFLAQGYLGQR